MYSNPYPIKRRKKLIEVAMPLQEINIASIREKSLRIGHPCTLHLWWARRPLATARAVIFCQIVDDPSDIPEDFPSEESQRIERERLFDLIKDFITWENSNNTSLFKRASKEINNSWKRFCNDNKEHPEASKSFDPNKLPSFYDPFCGGGTLPLEAQRLRIEAHGSDLNPVAVLINKAMIEIPNKFKKMKPVNPLATKDLLNISMKWNGADGLSNDIEYYGEWMKDEAIKKIGNCYPKIKITKEMVLERNDLESYLGKELTVVSWLWARTIKSLDPAFSHVNVPLIGSFMLSTKKGKEAYLKPIINYDNYYFDVKLGLPENFDLTNKGTKIGRGNFECLLSKTPITVKEIREQGMKEGLGKTLMAVVVEGEREKIFLPPHFYQLYDKPIKQSEWIPDIELQGKCRVNVSNYGLDKFSDLFTDRQLLALNTFKDLINEVKEKIQRDASISLESNDNKSLEEGGLGPKAYAEAISVYLSFAIDKGANYWSTLCSWNRGRMGITNTFGRQALPMVWDFAEANPLSNSTGNFMTGVLQASKIIKDLPTSQVGFAYQSDAQSQTIGQSKIISTDPPYFDNIIYSDLSDYFYVWLRDNLKLIFPKIFKTIYVPKIEELVVAKHRHKDKKDAEYFFLNGMRKALSQIANQSHPAFPITIYYAFKQTETDSNTGVSRTGWETFLESVISSGLAIKGTWPMSTELTVALKKNFSALSSTIILVCEKRLKTNKILSKSEYRRELRSNLPEFLSALEKINIPPVDIAQAAIGPGISIFSQVKSILNPDDSKMTVKDALIEINTALDEYLSKDDSELDIDTRFAITFFESFGYSERPFGDAEGLAKARNVSVEGVVRAGILSSKTGRVHLIKRENLPEEWDPFKDDRLCVWEAMQHLIKTLERKGESAAAELLNKFKNIIGRGDLATNCRSLAYRLYNHCSKKNLADEARSYNGLIISWPEIERIEAGEGIKTTIQKKLV